MVALILALVVLLFGFSSGWFAAHRNANEANEAQQDASAAQRDAAQASSNEEAAKSYLRTACVQGLVSACQQLSDLNRIPSPTPAPQNQEHEIQEPEIQDPEIQDPDTYCLDRPKRCQGERGPSGKPGIRGVPGPKGDTGVAGRGLSALMCNDEGHFVAVYSDGSSQELPDSKCAGHPGPKGEDAPTISGVSVTPDGSLIFQFSDGTTQTFSICPQGSSYQQVRVLTPEAAIQTFYACVTAEPDK
jgi:hypothetical protein